eukprot:4979124-Amphidinium_carterae.3
MVKEYEHLSSETLGENIKMGVLQACVAPTELREHLTLQAHRFVEEKERTKAAEEKETGKRRRKAKRRSAVTHQRRTGLKVLVAGVDARGTKSERKKESQCHFKEAYTTQQKPAVQMAVLSGPSTTPPASHGTDYVLGLEQELSSMEAVSSKRPLVDSGAAAHACRPQYAKCFGTECVADKEEVTYKNASRGKVQRWEACELSQTVQRSDGTDGISCSMSYLECGQMCDSSGMCEASMFEHSTHGPYIPLSMVHGVYEVPVQKPEPADVSKQLQQEEPASVAPIHKETKLRREP